MVVGRVQPVTPETMSAVAAVPASVSLSNDELLRCLSVILTSQRMPPPASPPTPTLAPASPPSPVVATFPTSTIGGVIRRERERVHSPSPYVLPAVADVGGFRPKFTVAEGQSFVERVIREKFPLGSRLTKEMILEAVFQDDGIQNFKVNPSESKTWDVVRVILAKKTVCVHNGNRSSSGYYVRV